jgi:hypothetical protein
LFLFILLFVSSPTFIAELLVVDFRTSELPQLSQNRTSLLAFGTLAETLQFVLLNPPEASPPAFPQSPDLKLPSTRLRI